MASCEGERFIDEQLASIAAQTRPPEELVVFDDASEDSSFARVEAFAASAGFAVRCERNPERIGITRNFERALQACSGDVILLADQDDLWLPEKIEALCEVLEAEPGTGAVFSDGEIVDASGAAAGSSLWQALGFDSGEQRRVREGEAAYVFLRHVVAAGTTLAFRSRFLAQALPLPDLRSCHDAFIAFIVAAQAGVSIVDKPLIRYRVHGANQIGIQRLGLRQQLAKAREQIEGDAFGYAVEFFEVARERLPQTAPELRTAIDEKIEHARKRQRMPASWWARLPAIGEEAASGRYGRYSYGWKSIAQDLWLR